MKKQNDGISDELREALENMPEPIYTRYEESEELEPFPIFDGNQLNYVVKQINQINWILSQLPDTEENLRVKIQLITGRKQDFRIKLFLRYDLLKIENGKICSTDAIQKYAIQSIKNIKEYLKKKQEENQK